MKTAIVASMLALCLAGCGKSRGPGPERMREVAAAAGLSLPASARLVIDDTEPRSAAEGSFLRLIHANEAIRMPGASVSIPAATALAAVTTHVSSDQAGEAVETDASSGEWTNASGAWRGLVVHTTKGYWLYLEQFAQVKK